MLDDRDYMRQPEYESSGWRQSFRPRWSWTVILLVSYAVMFLLELVAQQFFPNSYIFKGHEILTSNGDEFIPGYLPLSLEGIEKGYVWQLITYQFMHAGWMHILLNSWMIYMFGREMEWILGGKKYLALVFSSGIVGGIFQMLAAFVWPEYFGGSVVGASACGFGLVAAYALTFPDRELTMLLLFFIPVHLRARTLLIASVVIAVSGFAFHDVFMPGVAHVAHLGGMAMGWFFVRKIMQGDWSRLSGTMRPAGKRVKQSAPRVQVEPLDEKPEGSFMESEVDPILDKISAHGIQSLTTREREILEAARKHVRPS
jgi:membrane associated rhomboid family serine protease